MSNKKQTIVAAASATMLVAGAVPAFAAPAVDADQAAAVAESGQAAVGVVPADAAQGTFAWDQATITPNEVIKQVFSTMSQTICGSNFDFVAANPLDWKIAVSGDVDNAYVATVDQLASEQSTKQTMTCTCGGNPADGKATVTAEVKGIPVKGLLDRAGLAEGVNTVTFVSSDGTEIAMPYAYVIGRHGVISYEVNGEDLSASVGGSNQLWLAGASANYFVRDIVAVYATAEDEVPAAPGEDMEYPNSPNAGVLGAEVG